MFILQNFEKIDFPEICLKNLVGFLETRADFATVLQDMLKMTVLSLSQHILGKVKSFETSRWFLCKMA